MSRYSRDDLYHHPELLQQLSADEQTESLCKVAVTSDPDALQWVKRQTPELCRIAVEQMGTALRWVKEQTPELCRAAILTDYEALRYVQDQTPELCQFAVESFPHALRWVHTETPEICRIAVEQDGHCLRWVQKQTPALCEQAMRSNPEALKNVHDQTHDLCLMAVRRNSWCLLYVTIEHTVDLCVTAIADDGRLLEAVRLPVDNIVSPDSEQLSNWLKVLSACDWSGMTSLNPHLLGLIQAIPLGKQYIDEWRRPSLTGGMMLDMLLELSAEMHRLLPDDTAVKSFCHRVNQQAEYHLRATQRPQRPDKTKAELELTL